MIDVFYDYELELPRDEEGRVVGFQVGKAAAMLDWQHRREEREYAELFERLAQAKYARERRARDPEAANERSRRWRHKNRAQVRAAENERRRVAAEKRRQNACVCGECGQRFTPEQNVKGTRWCSKRCANQHHGKRRTARGSRRVGERNMHVSSDILRALRRTPWLTLGQIFERMPNRETWGAPKRGSVASTLTTMVRDGRIVHDGQRKNRRYALPKEAS